MYILDLSVIIVSTIGGLSLFLVKFFEIKSGQPGVLTRVSLFADPTFSAFGSKLRRFWLELENFPFRKVLHQFIQGVFHLFGVTGLFIAKYHKQFINSKRQINEKGVVSFFLKDVAESRESKTDHGTQNTDHKM
ncbi:MAG: hypothetical protein V4467_02635 [Patescibacteria group bacterium]